MTNVVNRMAELCRLRNQTVMAAYSYGDMDLETFVGLEARKAVHNRQVGSLRDSADFEQSALSLAGRLLGETVIPGLKDSIKHQVICTADHHGSLYCSQFLQGDFLFALILEKLGSRNPVVPVLAAGQVELENSTYTRGFCAYTSRDQKMFMPLFPARHSVQLTSHADPVTTDMVSRFRKRFVDPETDPRLKQTLHEICSEIYETEEMRKACRLSDQMTIAGKKLMDRLFAGESPSFIYLEMETVLQPLFLQELSDESSLIYKILYDFKLREQMVREKLPDGLSLGDLLFRAADEKGRKIMLSLTEDGFLKGKDWRKEPVSFGTEPAELASLIREKRVFPGVFTEAIMLFFERGITWMGGMFQASYLPLWQAGLVRVLERTGYTAQAELIRNYDCSGYICGPMMALYQGDGFATTAGPVELWGNPVPFDKIRQSVRETSLWDGHLIGLSEMYFDLTVRDEREPDWYRKISEELYRAYPGNFIV